MSESNLELVTTVAEEVKDVIPIRRPRGRPKGSRNQSVQFNSYHPKKWEAWMDGLVVHHICGKTNKELSKLFDITEGHVSNLLNSPQANERKELYRSEVLKSAGDVASKLAHIQELGLKRVTDFLKMDELAKSSPITYVSQAKEILKMTFPKGEVTPPPSGNVTNIQNNILATNPEFMERMVKGLETANEVALMHEEKRLKLVSGEK